MEKELKSPCIGICFYDHDKDHCTGCFRTLEEIGKWCRMSEKEKKTVLSKTEKRKIGREPAG